ncbi:hypothetical protein [Marinomonas colpomeniae]|uniref:YjcQ protein n=1 Tax=Marinomonas colpomeniae TaxID=2774408 RepID=A0ABR8P0W1_9GAMM|nr:hypothetical protein [Marinomonas colpomeniae]MBD5771808.1 hypothetical protein [Marinomonas colpomeniae]
MEAHKYILQYLIDNPDIKSINETSDIDVTILKDLIQSGLVNGANACSDDGYCFLEPRISLSGREWLASFDSQVNSTKSTEDIVELKPNFFGLGVNLNALFRCFRRK